MACMCGDLYCGSCGPAQGNSKCEQCSAWTMDGGCADPVACEAAQEEMLGAMEREEAARNEAEARYWQDQRERGYA